MSSWRKAGFSFNKYLQIAAQTTRNALKAEAQTSQVLARSKTEAKVLKFENGVVQEAQPLQQ